MILEEYFAVVVNALEGKECSVSMAEVLEHNTLSEEKLSSIVSGMLKLLREALRLPATSIKQEVCSAGSVTMVTKYCFY